MGCRHDARGPARLLPDARDGGRGCAAQHDLRRAGGACDRAPALPRAGTPQRGGRPAIRRFAGGGGACAAARVRPARRLGGPVVRRPGRPDHLLDAGHDPGHDVRLAAVRGARGDPGAARDRDRAGAGRSHAWRRAAADLLPRDAACDPLGRRLRRGAHDRAGARRVRRGERRVRQAVRADRDRDAVRGEPLPALRRDRRLCRRGRARAAGARDALRHEPDQAEGGADMSIVIDSVSKRFGEFAALEDVSLEVRDGSLTALLGPSGGGKSTLLRVIAGLETPDAGRVDIAGEDATEKPPQRRNVGFVFQHYAAFKHMTVAKNVAFGLTIRKRPKDEIDERVNELLKLVHLDGFAHRYPSQLSGGQRQRMALARALAVQPRVLLLDEPFGALDATVRKELRAWLRRLHDEVHVTTVFVTHDQEEAMEVAEQIVVLNDGRIEQVGSPKELYEQPANEFVMGFVGPISELSGRWIRPHDVEILLEPRDGAAEAAIDRVLHLGFEVRVELTVADGEKTWVQTTRAEADELKLSEGQTVWLRADADRGRELVNS